MATQTGLTKEHSDQPFICHSIAFQRKISKRQQQTLQVEKVDSLVKNRSFTLVEELITHQNAICKDSDGSYGGDVKFIKGPQLAHRRAF